MSDVQVFISGAGVAGLLLALALKKMNLNVTVYEQAPAFADGVGGEFAVDVVGIHFDGRIDR